MLVPPSLKFAFRSLRRTPVFSIVAILTLIIGIGAVASMLALVNGVLLRPLPYGNSEQLVGAWHRLPGVNIDRGQQTSATYFTYRKLSRSIEDIGIYQDGSVNVSDPSGGGEPQRLTSGFVTASLGPTLGVRPLLGRHFTESEELPNSAPVVLISEGLWRSRFGADRGVIGRTLEVNGRSREIVGVMPEHFRFPAAETQLWLPLTLDPAAQFPGGFSYNGIVRLKPGVTVAAAQRELDALLPRVSELYPMMAPGVPWKMVIDQAKPAVSLVPLRDDLTSDIARTLWMLFAAATLVLLVACANVSNLMLVRADARQRELAVREALGAGRRRILTHYLAESVVLCGIATAAGVFLAWGAVRMLVATAPVEIPRLAEVSIDATTIVAAVLIGLVATVACSLFPALRLGNLRLSSALREGGRSGTAGRAQHRVRGALVAAQIALALVVLAGSGLLLRTFQRLNAVQPGFDAGNVLTMWIALPQATYQSDTAVVQFYSGLTERVAQLPGVTRVGLGSRVPLTRRNMNQNPFYPEGDASYQNTIPPLQIFTTVDSGYFGAMRIPIIAGRTFVDQRVQPDLEAVISRRTAMQFFKDSTGANAIGRRFSILPGGPKYTVIGVAGDVRDTALAALPSQAVYFPQAVRNSGDGNQTYRTLALVVRTANDPIAAVAPIQRIIRELDPALPTFDVRSMSEVTRRSTARLTFMTLILGAAALVTLLLGAIGLYGVMAYIVTLRTKEMGVRIALGAQPGAVAVMMTRQGLTLTAFGLAAGAILFVIVARFLRSFLYDTTPMDPVALAGASVLLLAVASIASLVPALRAARANPVEALRSE